ncbi:MAG: PRC-barrel domain-containing protein [Myxococcota bacterium]
MSVMSNDELKSKKVMSQDGREVGEIDGVHIDTKTWAVTTISVKLRRDLLESLDLDKPMFGSQTVQVTVQTVSGVGDAVVLKTALSELSFIGGTPADGD